MIEHMKRINPPDLEDKVHELALRIEEDLEINEDVVFIRHITSRKMEWFTLPFSYHLALMHLNIKFFPRLGVGGLLKTPTSFLFTKQSKINKKLKSGVVIQRDSYYSISCLGSGKASEYTQDPITESMFFELEEEVGLNAEDVEVKKVVKKEYDNYISFFALMITELDDEQVKGIMETAIDKWEIAESHFVSDVHAFLPKLPEHLRSAVEELIA